MGKIEKERRQSRGHNSCSIANNDLRNYEGVRYATEREQEFLRKKAEEKRNEKRERAELSSRSRLTLNDPGSFKDLSIDRSINHAKGRVNPAGISRPPLPPLTIAISSYFHRRLEKQSSAT